MRSRCSAGDVGIGKQDFPFRLALFLLLLMEEEGDDRLLVELLAALGLVNK